VPDHWLAGQAGGARRQEDVRHECEDVAGTGPVIWTGQLAAAAALAARDHGSGHYLVCDLGGTGIRAGMFAITDGTVGIMTVHTAEGGGWQNFDQAVRSRMPSWLPARWYEETASQRPRAELVLADALAAPAEFGDTRAYRISGPAGHADLTAGQVIDSFAPSLQRLRAVVEAASTTEPDRVVLTGGLSWLPLAARALADATGSVPITAGPDASARGALLFARGAARTAPPPSCQPVALPTRQIRDGLLEDVRIDLSWTAPFAALPGGSLQIDRDELELAIGAVSRTVRLPGLEPGLHRIGIRPSWPGPGLLVARAVTGDRVHVVPLAGLEAAQ
jgi:hypothetical protein